MEAESGGEESYTYATGNQISGSMWDGTDYGDVSTNKEMETVTTAGQHIHSITGSTGTYGSGSEVIAKYYALCFIMKL